MSEKNTTVQHESPLADRMRPTSLNDFVGQESLLGEGRMLKEIIRSGNPARPPACILSGGETTVTISGNGLGGRNQEFALAAAMDIEGEKWVALLSGGTDGTDGPTDAAGAICDTHTLKRAAALGMRPGEYLSNNDAYHFFDNLGDLLITGPTRTNVMDLRIMLVV